MWMIGDFMTGFLEGVVDATKAAGVVAATIATGAKLLK